MAFCAMRRWNGSKLQNLVKFLSLKGNKTSHSKSCEMYGIVEEEEEEEEDLVVVMEGKQ